MRDVDLRDHALALRQLGLSVIPVPRPDAHHDGKKPIIAWRDYQHRLPTDDEITAWFATPQNLGIITGAISGVVVVDADSPDAVTWIRKRMPYTPWQTKTARGYHLWYRHPDLPVRNRARIATGSGRLALDVRGDGGYVIGPGSMHATGAIYRATGDWTVPRDRLPRFWPGWIARPVTPPATSAPPARRPTGDVVERARRYLARIPRPEIGQGSDEATLKAACRVVRGFDVPPDVAVDLLYEWAGGRPGWTREWVEAKVAAALLYGREPIGALR